MRGPPTYAAAEGALRRLALVAGAGHNGILAHPSCWDEISAFLEQVVGGVSWRAGEGRP